MMNNMAARGVTQQQYAVKDGGALRTAWPEPAEGLPPADLSTLPTVWPNEVPESGIGLFASSEELERALFDRLVDPQGGEVRFTAGQQSSRRVRRLTMSALESWGLGGHGEVAAQLVSELIANAVRHTGGRTFGLRLVRRHGCVRFEVYDPSRALPCLILGEPEDEGGRGLQLVDKLSQRWGADLMSHGKSVWFELRVREAAPSA